MFRFRLLIVIGFAASLLMTGVGMIVPLLPARVMDLSGSLRSAGLIASTFAVAYLLVQLPLGRLPDRLGVKPFLLFGYLACSGAGVLFFFAGSAEAVFAGRFVQGIGEAPIWALGPALLPLAYPLAKGRVIGLYNAAIHVGLTAGPLLGPLTDRHGRHGYMVAGLVMSALGFASFMAVGQPWTYLPMTATGKVIRKALREQS